MVSNFSSSRNGFEIGFQFSQQLIEELEDAGHVLNSQELSYLRNYYHGFLRGEEQRSIRRLYYARRLQDVLDKLLCDPQRPLIIDAACGLGSTSILFGLLGADIVGIDINAERLNIAQKRVKYYERKNGGQLAVRFLNKDICDYSHEKKVDIVHCQESISHIHPAKQFLVNSYNLIKNGGHIIISDANALNPIPLYRAIKERGFRPYTLRKDPVTNKTIGYAVERYFTVWGMKRLLKNAGFEIELVRMSCFVPHQLTTLGDFSFWKKWEIELSKVPVVSSFGGVYVVTARKE